MKLRSYSVHGEFNGRSGPKQTIWILGDPHFLSPGLFREDAASFQEAKRINDGKAIERMLDLLDEFFSLIRRERPDAVLFPGDLTLNGEKEGLEYLSRKFDELAEEQIRLLVIPGNHDTDCRYALNFTEDQAVPAEKVTPEDFYRLMGPYGYQNADSAAPDSFSWIVSLTEDIRILGFDTYTKEFPGGITERTMRWGEEELRKARLENAAVITMTHYNVLSQNLFMEQGFLLKNHREAEDLLKRYEVCLNLSGHIHLQHSSRKGNLCDIASECASVFPLGYGVLEIAEGHKSWNYHREYFRLHQASAEARMESAAKRFLASTLAELDGLPEEDIACMEKAGVLASKCLFAGWPFEPEDEDTRRGYVLWKTHDTVSFWGRYLNMIMNQGHLEEEL